MRFCSTWLFDQVSARRTAGWMIVLWAVVAVTLVLSGHAYAHSGAHGEAYQQGSGEKISHVDQSSPGGNDHADTDHDHHHHSGDPVLDLLTLGHTHAGGSGSAGLPATPWMVPDAVVGTLPMPTWRSTRVGDSPPSNPFRPPIS